MNHGFPHKLKPLKLLGDYSYSVYLFHEFIVIAMWKFYKNTAFAQSGSTLAVARVFYYLSLSLHSLFQALYIHF